MAEQNVMEPWAIGVDGDLRDQALVLDRLLVHWPVQLQEADLLRELRLGEDEFEQRDRVDRAVVELEGAGLVARCGSVVLPTRAALHYRALSDGTPVDL
ncbi:MAG: hypothetical protein AB7V58_12435 [Solirubrobacterales bacterium]